MAKQHKYRFSLARGVEITNRTVAELQASGTIMRTAGAYSGRKVEVDGRHLYNFGSCSYMGLERRKELSEGAAHAAFEYGTQFPFSRAYLECPLYQTLEATLTRMTDRPVLVAASTTLAHLAALPVLIGDNDAIVIDQFAHASLHMATELLRDVPVHVVRHGRSEELEKRVAKLSEVHEHVWLILDGVYSMLGDIAPYDTLLDLLNAFPRLHLYIDDAHATSWFGQHGRGGALTRLGQHNRVIVVLSLNKAFSAAGGAIALPNDGLKMRIRRCGGPMLFSGPIQPPMLGAAVASARFHLTSEHASLQQELMRRIDFARSCADEAGLHLASGQRTPVFFLRCDAVREVNETVLRLWDEGFYVCPSTFPAVPMNWPGIRFTVTLHNEREDIESFIAAVRRVQPATARVTEPAASPWGGQLPPEAQS